MPRKSPVFIVGSSPVRDYLLCYILLAAGGFAIYRIEVDLSRHMVPAFSQLGTRARADAFWVVRPTYAVDWMPSSSAGRSSRGVTGPGTASACRWRGSLLRGGSPAGQIAPPRNCY